MSLLIKARTALALGLPNLLRVFIYRFSVFSGINPVKRLSAPIPKGPYFNLIDADYLPYPVSDNWHTHGKIFGRELFSVCVDAPDWHQNVITKVGFVNANQDWWSIPDFDPLVGDIKCVWELSRFDWMLPWAQRYRAGDAESLNRLNHWLDDWCKHNPPYKGPNWKCGQEASIRVMHLAITALILKQVERPCVSLLSLVTLHLKRIAPTISYAVAQDNNHGTSEAAALYIGGSFLERHGISDGKRWKRQGLRWLEERASRLILADGGFSQYSLNYHRVMLDTFSMVEVWRQHLGLPELSLKWYERSRAAANWLFTMINPETGDGPNVGANDGARLFQLTDTDYRDFRPSVQLAMGLFANARAYAESGMYDVPFQWLCINLPEAIAEQPTSKCFSESGFTALHRNRAFALMRFPKFVFRPSHADALHVDLWVAGRNLLRDAGTFSYNTDLEWQKYFPGTQSHNTVQFDGRDQMPRISRFLFGDWLKNSRIEPLSIDAFSTKFAAGYIDNSNCEHFRRVSLFSSKLLVEDHISGFNYNAVLRWRLEPGNWTLEGNTLNNGEHSIVVHSTTSFKRFELVQGWESHYYLEKHQVPVLEVEVSQPGILTTEFHWVS